MDEAALESLAREIVEADHVVVLTGAGLSTASGIPDFRSDGGVWDRLDPGDFHIDRFRADPAGFWTDRLELHKTLYTDETGPNAAHEAIATLQDRGHLDIVLTQNVDGLHEAAGTTEVRHLHGTSRTVECVECGTRRPAEPVRERAAAGDLPPQCSACAGIFKPAVVLFGEQLPADELTAARRHAADADVFIAAGSSLTVEPVASLPRRAARNGATLAIVNLDQTPVSPLADYDWRADVTEAFPSLCNRVGELVTNRL